jgi:hypothetical protein
VSPTSFEIEGSAGFVEDNWPETATMADTELRLAVKLGLFLLWSGRLVCVAAEFDNPVRPRSPKEISWLEVRGVSPAVSLIREFRDMLADAATTVGSVAPGSAGWFNWIGPHIPDAERVDGWMSPSAYEKPSLPRRLSAGQIQEAELDNAMLLVGLALREFAICSEESGREV